jgi:hypothetical protein
VTTSFEEERFADAIEKVVVPRAMTGL